MATNHLLFLSHSGDDTAAALALRERLLDSPEAKEHGLNVFVDAPDLRAGARWKDQLQDALDRSTAFAVYVGSRGVVNWVWDEVSVALDRVHEDPSYPLIPVLSEKADVTRLPSFLRQFQAVRNVEADSKQLGNLIIGALRLTSNRHVAIEAEPFQGLSAFDSGRAHLFYGREQETAALVRACRAEALIMVVGDSGSGKSSLVKAGLVTKFKRGALAPPGAEGQDESAWLAIESRPGAWPFRALANVLVDIARTKNWSPKACDELAELVDSRNPEKIRRAIRMVAPPNAEVLLVIDQFEELFTLADAGDQKPFAETILGLADPKDTSVRVVLTMRWDYYHRCSTLPALYERLEANNRRARFTLGAMTMGGLRACIEKPLELAGRPEVERRALADVVLKDVGQRPSNLALVEMALTRAWKKRAEHGGNMIEAYIAIGRVDGALASTADEVVDDRLAEAEKPMVEPLFVRLVKLGDTGGASRRIAQKRELGGGDLQDDRAAATPWELAQKLAKRHFDRLVVVSETTAEITHEALVTSWGRYADWLTNNREANDLRGDDKRRLDGLMEEARRWTEASDGDKPTLLANELELRSYSGLHDRRPAWISEDERDFIAASERTRWWRVFWWRSAAAALIVLTLSSVLLAGGFYFSQQQVEEALHALSQRQSEVLRQQSRLLARMSHEALQKGEMFSAARFALAGLPRSQQGARLPRDAEVEIEGGRPLVPEAAHALHASGGQLLGRLVGRHTEEPRALGFLEKSAQTITFDRLLGTTVGDAEASEPKYTIRPGSLVGPERDGKIIALAWAPEAKRLAAGYRSDLDVHVLAFDADGTAGHKLFQTRGYDESMVLAWSPDGTALAASYGRVLLIWSNGKTSQIALDNDATILTWSPDGRHLALARRHSGSIEVLTDVLGVHRSTTLTAPTGVHTLAWNGSDLTAATSGAASTRIVSWRFQNDAWITHDQLPIRDSSEEIGAMAWSADGGQLAYKVASDRLSGYLNLWVRSAGRGIELGGMRSNRAVSNQDGRRAEDNAQALVWSRGSRVAASFHLGADRFVQVWQMEQGLPKSTVPLDFGRREGLTAEAIAWSGEDSLLVAAAFGAEIKLWSVSGEVSSRQSHDKLLYEVERAHVAADGIGMAASSPQGRLVIGSARHSNDLVELQGPQRIPQVMALTPDGSRMALVDPTGGVFVRDRSNADFVELPRTTVARGGRPVRAQWSANGRRLAVLFDQSKPFLWVWDLEHQATPPISVPLDDVDWGTHVWTLAWSQEGTHLAVALRRGQSGIGEVRAWRWDAGMISSVGLGANLEPTEFAEVLAWSPGGKLAAGVATARDSGPVRRRLLVWDLPSTVARQAGDGLRLLTGWYSLAWRGEHRIVAALRDDALSVTVVAYEGEAYAPRQLTPELEGIALGFREPRAGEEYGAIMLRKLDRFEVRELDRSVETPLTLSSGIRNPTNAWAASGKLAVADADTGRILLFDTAAWEQPVEFQGKRHLPVAIAVAPNKSRLASVSGAGTLRIWRSPSDYQDIQLPQNSMREAALAWSASGKYLAVSDGYSTRVFQSGTDGILAEMRELRDGGLSLAWSGDQKLALGSLSSSTLTLSPSTPPLNLTIHVYDVLSPQSEYRPLRMNVPGIDWNSRMALAWSPSGDALAFATTSKSERRVLRFTPSPSNAFRDADLIEVGRTDQPGELALLAWSADGRYLAANAAEGRIFVWPLLELPTLAEQVSKRLRQVELTPEEERVAGFTASGGVDF